MEKTIAVGLESNNKVDFGFGSHNATQDKEDDHKKARHENEDDNNKAD